MDKSARRQKRKEKDRDRDRRRSVDNTPFDNANPNYREALLRLYRRATDEYSSLLKVVEIDSQLRLNEQEALDYSGFGKRYKPVFFNTAVDDGYEEFRPAYKGDFSIGGWIQVVTGMKGERRIIVFMKRSLTKPHDSDVPNIAMFLHELGHVDDVHHGIHWLADKPVNMEAMELYAHQFACRRLMDGRFMLPLTIYIDFTLEQLSAASVASIAQAALRFKESPLYRECQKFLGPMLGSFKSGYDEGVKNSANAKVTE